jgi:hypothetical protein
VRNFSWHVAVDAGMRLTIKIPVAAVAVTSLALLAGAGSNAAVAADVIASDVTGPALSDGRDTLAFLAKPGTARLLDGSGGDARDVAVGDGCLTPPTEISAVGGGQVVVQCQRPHTSIFADEPRDEPRLLDVATLQLRDVVGAGRILDYADDSSSSYSRVGGAVGTAGIAYTASGYHWAVWGGLDWRTGASVRDPSSATAIIDLDSPSLTTSLCAPLTRVRNPLEESWPDGSAFEPYAYEAPYGLSWSSSAPLRLQRCGSSAATVLQPRTRIHPGQPQLDAGFVTWTMRGVGPSMPLYGYLPRCGLRLRWAVSPLTRTAHLTDALVVSETWSGIGRWRISRIPLDGACARIERGWRVTVAASGRRVALTPTSATRSRPAGAPRRPCVRARPPRCGPRRRLGRSRGAAVADAGTSRAAAGEVGRSRCREVPARGRWRYGSASTAAVRRSTACVSRAPEAER